MTDAPCKIQADGRGENVWLRARHQAMWMQKEMASIPKVGLIIRSLDDQSWEKREKSEISGRDLQKPFGEFKTVNFILLTKYCSHHTEISTKDIVTLRHDAVFCHLSKPERKKFVLCIVTHHRGRDRQKRQSTTTSFSLQEQATNTSHSPSRTFKREAVRQHNNTLLSHLQFH